MDDIIERSLAGEATESERIRLDAWRRASTANEAHYRRTERLLKAARALSVATPSTRPPSASSIIAAVDRVGRSARTRQRVWRWAPWLIATAALVVAALNLRAPTNSPASPGSEVVTGSNELATVKLADGSVVRLAPSSRLQIDGGASRAVRLDGRAFFAVTKSNGQPFRVYTQSATANVLGTRFELATNEKEVRLAVLEGRVVLDARDNSVDVGAGQISTVRLGTAVAPTAMPEHGSAPQWLGKFLVFQATPLNEAAAEIEQLYRVRVVVADSVLSAATITATFTDRPVDDVVRVVCAVVNAQCTIQDGIVSITR
jgi:ferric-dicitrate binding protein FerR (iron transport regulator)